MSGNRRTPARADQARPDAERREAEFATIEEAIEEIRQGNMVVVVDDEDRENEGDLTMAAQFVTPEAVNFMAKEGRGLICLALTPERCDELGLDLMAAKNESAFGTAFTISIEARSAMASQPASPRPTERARFRSRSTRTRVRGTSSSRATCSR